MGDFIAKEKLSEVDFGHFSRQCCNDLERHRSYKKRLEIMIDDAERDLISIEQKISESESYCRKHGVKFDAV